MRQKEGKKELKTHYGTCTVSSLFRYNQRFKSMRKKPEKYNSKK